MKVQGPNIQHTKFNDLSDTTLQIQGLCVPGGTRHMWGDANVPPMWHVTSPYSLNKSGFHMILHGYVKFNGLFS